MSAPINPENIITPEKLKALSEQYPLTGSIVFASDGSSFTSICYDEHGNELRLIASAGDFVRYEEKRKS